MISLNSMLRMNLKLCQFVYLTLIYKDTEVEVAKQ